MMWGIVVFAGIFLQCYAQDLVVELPTGKVQGTTLNSPSGRKFYAWKAIPYAQPPVGSLRFLPPTRPEPWTGILDGTRDAKVCHFFTENVTAAVPASGYSEDCLYLNVYSPVEPNSSLRLPVMFWIHGGGFVAGSGDFAFYDPTPFLAENVIVVTINYRLGVLGFLSTEDEVVPGNGALKDQLQALIWVRENIALFGGNVLDVTLFGESAGAMSVGYHLIGHMSRNLFSGAILQSGSSLVNTQTQTGARNQTLRLAINVNASITVSSTSQQILGALQAANVQTLINTTIHQGMTFGPVLEVPNFMPFMTQSIYEAIESGDITQVPIIIGTNSEETIYKIPDIGTGLLMAQMHDDNPDMLLPAMHFKDGINTNTVAQQIKQQYVGSEDFKDHLGLFVNWMSDNNFTRPAIKHAVLHSQYAPVYFYQFSYVGTPSSNHIDIPGAGRVGHADELSYLFNITTRPISTAADYVARQRLVRLWTNFAKTKNPTPILDPVLQNLTWSQFNRTSLQYLNIDSNITMVYNQRLGLTAFWDYIWETYSYRPYNTF